MMEVLAKYEDAMKRILHRNEARLERFVRAVEKLVDLAERGGGPPPPVA